MLRQSLDIPRLGKPARSEPGMKPDAVANPMWRTASFSHAPDTSPMELSELGEHLEHCSARSARLTMLRIVAESVHGFISTRLVTTLALLSLPILLMLLL
jgi:hypothetical protein